MMRSVTTHYVSINTGKSIAEKNIMNTNALGALVAATLEKVHAGADIMAKLAHAIALGREKSSLSQTKRLNIEQKWCIKLFTKRK